MFDWVTYALCFLFLIPTTLIADKVCHFELKYLESFGDRQSFYPKYASRHPIIAFGLITLFNFVSTFCVYGSISFAIYLLTQVLICTLGFLTLHLKKIPPKVFDYVSVFLSLANMVILLVTALT